jgi:hypothetical protein
MFLRKIHAQQESTTNRGQSDQIGKKIRLLGDCLLLAVFFSITEVAQIFRQFFRLELVLTILCLATFLTIFHELIWSP